MHFLHLFGGDPFLGRIDLEQPEQCQVVRRCVESATRFWFKCVRRHCLVLPISDGHVAACKIETARSHVQWIQQFISHEFWERALTGSVTSPTENAQEKIRCIKMPPRRGPPPGLPLSML